MRLGCLGIMLAAGLLWGGAQGTYEWASNRQPRVMTYAQFVKERPTGGWVKITGCSLDLGRAMWLENSLTKQKEKFFVPVSDAKTDALFGDKKPGQTVLLIETQDPQYKTMIEGVAAMDEKKVKDEEALMWVLKNQEKLFPKKDLSGTIKFGIHSLESSTREQLAGLGDALDPNFAVLEDGVQPKLGPSLAMLGGGLALTLFMGAMMLRGGKNAAPRPAGQDVPPNPPAAPPGPFST